ncbi:hypothetical protein [Halobellus rufus]|uniref:hypothetical protein n=1 Tax=Halobellus rufus TaxID=1448860 RepID=UPI0012E04C41|nr:hypothetical protein [Halobellus rufus]
MSTEKEDEDLLKQVHDSDDGEETPGMEEYMDLMEKSERISKRVEEYTARANKSSTSASFSSQSN